MATFKALSRGTQLVLVGGPLLVLSLFFTWQHIEVDYGAAGTATVALDGWDAWGLLLGLLTVTLTTIVVLSALTEVELAEDFPWQRLTLGLGLAIPAVALVKSLTDAGSSWESYGFVGLAFLVGLGTVLDWAAARRDEASARLARKRRGLRSAA